MERTTFTSAMIERRRPRGIDVTMTLRDFAIVTYAIPPQRLLPHLAPRFAPELIDITGGKRALVSVVPFRDTAFRLAGWPSPGIGFGQTNYRAYVRDRTTGSRAAWFFGTALDSKTVAVPRHVWQLPWYRARIRFDCTFDATAKRYTAYSMRTDGAWGGAALEIDDSGLPPVDIAGFPDLETALVVLTHPLFGVYRRRDGKLGGYDVWHDRLAPTVGHCRSARFDALDTLGLVPFAEQPTPHSVLLQSSMEFTIYLPPHTLTNPIEENASAS
jgi:hypothetical protein